jgi:hypothetical protein
MDGTFVLRIVIMVMVAVILSTITLAVLSYGAFRMRERRRPDRQVQGPAGHLFFERVHLVPTRSDQKE